MIGMPMCGHTSPPAVGMWTVMMATMMLPSFAHALWRYHQAIPATVRMSVLMGAGYFLVWTVIGLAAFPASIAMTALAHAVPDATAAVVLAAGAFQFTAWKTRLLACCRFASGCGRASWQDGLRLGLHCAACCVGFTAILLVTGGMELRAMTALTAAITIERWAPAAERVARSIGAGVIATGLLLIVR